MSRERVNARKCHAQSKIFFIASMPPPHLPIEFRWLFGYFFFRWFHKWAMVGDSSNWLISAHRTTMEATKMRNTCLSCRRNVRVWYVSKSRTIVRRSFNRKAVEFEFKMTLDISELNFSEKKKWNEIYSSEDNSQSTQEEKRESFES